MEDYSEADLVNLFPLVIPKELWGLSNWTWPTLKLIDENLGLTWVVMNANQTMTYSTHEQLAYFESKNLDYMTEAEANLRKSSTSGLWTHEKRKKDGAIEWVSMMHGDGLGTSRLLLEKEITSELGPGYTVALPDRSCAVVFPHGAEEESHKEMIQKMFDGANSPLIPEIITSNGLNLFIKAGKSVWLT